MFSSKAIFLIPVLVAAATMAGCGSGTTEKSAAQESAPISVHAAAVTQTEVADGYVATGTVHSRTAATISSKVMGYVQKVDANVGDSVPAGKVLVVIDSKDLEAHVNQAQAAVDEARTALADVENGIAAAKANLDLTQATFNRIKDLFEKKSVTNQEYDEATAKLSVARANYQSAQSKHSQVKSKVAQAEAALNAAQVMKAYTTITSPFAGMVTEKSVEEGNLAAPGQPLLTIERTGQYRMEVPVGESRMHEIRPGQKVVLSIGALDRTIDATVTELVPAVDSMSRTFLVRINLPSGLKVQSGMFGRATFATGSRQALVVPEEAIQTQGQVQGVFVVDNGRARLRLVTLGSASGNGHEVLSGLDGGEQVIFPLPPGIHDGSRVEVRP